MIIIGVALTGYLSVTEVEVVVGVVIVFTLAEAGANEVETNWEPWNSEPDAQAVVNDDTVKEEAFEAAVHEVEEPLLGRIRAMVPDVAASIRSLLVEVLLTVPGAVLHLGHTETLTVGKSHILHVSELVMGKSTSYTQQHGDLLVFTAYLSRPFVFLYYNKFN